MQLSSAEESSCMKWINSAAISGFEVIVHESSSSRGDEIGKTIKLIKTNVFDIVLISAVLSMAVWDSVMNSTNCIYISRILQHLRRILRNFVMSGHVWTFQVFLHARVWWLSWNLAFVEHFFTKRLTSIQEQSAGSLDETTLLSNFHVAFCLFIVCMLTFLFE